MDDKSAQLLLNEILQITNEGYLITDGAGDVIYVNQQWKNLCVGDTPIHREIIGGNVREFRMYIDFTSVAEHVLQNKKPFSQVYHPVSKRVILSSGTPILDEAGNLRYIIVKVNDISDIFHLKDQVENITRIKELYTEYLKTHSPVEQNPIQADAKMMSIYQQCITISVTNATVLLMGESGVGKEVVANFIHNQSQRRDKPFLSINCGAIPADLIESELFGYAAGAFTGAARAGKKGIIEAAHQGTLFLDEIADMPLNMQVKMLRVLEDRNIRPIGATQSIEVDVRFIVATNGNLPKMVEEGLFRKDLYYRINVINVFIPPLRQRPDDIAALADYYRCLFNTQYHFSPNKKQFSREIFEIFKSYGWPGNVRELRNVVEQLVLLSEKDQVDPETARRILEDRDPFEENKARSAVSVNRVGQLNEIIEETERQLFEKAAKTGRSSREIAKLLNVSQTTVVRKLKKYLPEEEQGK